MTPTKRFIYKKIDGMDSDRSKLIQLKERRKQLNEEIEQIEAKLNEIETKVLIRMSKEDLDWCWKITSERKIIKWKEEFIEYVGKKAADLLVARTSPKQYIHVGVKGFDDK